MALGNPIALFTTRIFVTRAGDPNWVGMLGLILVIGWIIYRISQARTEGRGGGGSVY